MFHPPRLLWALIFCCLVLLLPLPPAQRSHADADVQALQSAGDSHEQPGETASGGATQGASGIDETELESRILARLRHELHGEVDASAMRSMEQAMRGLREREGTTGERPLGKVLRLTFRLEPELVGAAPLSVLTRTTAYSAFADTVLGGTVFRLNIAGDLSMKGLQHDRVALGFSTLLQFEDAANQESGSSGATGSAVLALGEPETLMSVGARDLVLTVDEVGLP